MIKQIRYIFEAFLLLIVLAFSKMLPVTMASNFGGFIGRNIGARLAASRKAKRNAQMVFPDKSAAEIDTIIIGMWDNLGRVMMEYAHLKKIITDNVEIVGSENINLSNKSGSIIISGHLANWEIVPPYLSSNFALTFVPIYRAPNNPYSDYLLKKARSFGNKIETIPKSKSGTRKIVESLKTGKQIGMVIDQKYNEGIEVDFLGTPAMTSPIFAQLGLKYDVPIIPLNIERLKGPHFRITIHPPMEKLNKTPEQIVNQSHELLKEWIFKNPEQWLWLHNRWKNKNNKNKI